MLVVTDEDKKLAGNTDINSEYFQRLKCNECRKNKKGSACRKCIQRYLNNMQRLEEIRRL